MATGEDIGFLEESSHENSNDSSSYIDPVGEPALTERGARALSSPAVLQPSKDEFRYQNNGRPKVPLRKTLAGSCPGRLSEVTPLLIPNTELSEHEESEQVSDEEQRDERRSTCSDFLDGFLDSLVLFRNSKLIHVVQVLLAPLPISAVIMGILYADRCPYLPISSGVIGVLGTVFIGMWISMAVCQQRGTPCMDHQKFSIGFTFVTLVFLAVIDTTLLGHMSPSFTPGDRAYCHKTFYHYYIKKEIFTGLAFALAALIYLPRSRHYFCCCDCCMSQPPLPNLEYLSL